MSTSPQAVSPAADTARRGAERESAEAERAERGRKPVAVWLLLCCAMVFGMVVLGGVTRLTHSGLSMVEWKPLTGLLPPLTQAEWEAAFRAYQQFPEYQKLNAGMTLEGFQSIFWLEYVHRLWGRLIGLVFAVPFLYFLLTGRIRRSLWPHLVGLFALGALQGLLGWYMVKSGLVDRPDVGQYRLAAHLGLALLIYGYMFRIALGLLAPDPGGAPAAPARLPLRFPTAGLAVLVFVTVLSGGFVAGLDAGLAYNTFPLMGGQLVPAGMFVLEPPLANFFENIVTVQFTHRVLAMLVFASVVVLWWRAMRTRLPPRTRCAFHALLGAVLLQVTLGIWTLLLMVPVALAASHQAGALILFTAVLWTEHELQRVPRARPTQG